MVWVDPRNRFSDTIPSVTGVGFDLMDIGDGFKSNDIPTRPKAPLSEVVSGRGMCIYNDGRILFWFKTFKVSLTCVNWVNNS